MRARETLEPAPRPRLERPAGRTCRRWPVFAASPYLAGWRGATRPGWRASCAPTRRRLTASWRDHRVADEAEMEIAAARCAG